MAGVEDVNQDKKDWTNLGLPLTKRCHRLPLSITDTPLDVDLTMEWIVGQESQEVLALDSCARWQEAHRLCLCTVMIFAR